MSDADPRCPECGGPIGRTATYCMHCSADLTDEQAAADADGDGAWDDAGSDDAASGDATSGDADVPWVEADDGGAEADPDPAWGPDSGTATGADAAGSDTTGSGASAGGGEPTLDPDGLVDNSLTAIVGIAGGLFVGVVGTIALLIITGSAWGFLLGVLAWLGSTVYLVRRRTVQGAVAKSGYAVAAVLLALPLVAFSPIADVDGGLTGRVTFFVGSLLAVAVPAGFAAGLGYLASRFVPEDAGEGAT